MGIRLGENQYGKAENRVVRIYRDTPRHEIVDINVGTALRGDFEAAHTVGDQGAVLPTDTQKQTCYAFAKEKGIATIEQYALDLAHHFVDENDPVHGARIEVERYGWERATVDGADHDHTWVRSGAEVRTADITVEGKGSDQTTWVIGGLKDLTILKSTGSEFHGFPTDRYTILEPTTDRVMATSLVAKWRFTTTDVDWDAVYADVKQLMVAAFATLQSLALQQTLYAMGTAVLEAHPEIAEVRLSAPNKHHFVYDLARFGIENHNEVFHADDRPYGLIQASVIRDDAPDAGPAWTMQRGWLA
ncbi:MAG: urate oxidase [Corynebacteriales bacterium]|uniref:Uricase n=1 Tax=Williamsia herbipolensis TaxID=1603258 RepID=A0AAU4K826_9NOCA|nr:urate oxidase [Williamsia herbipolensis]MCX6469563.1 urate oxidase [Mycobacteriales bacterium]